MRVLQQDGEWARVEAAIFNLLYEPCIGGIIVNCRKIGSRKIAKGHGRYLVAEEVKTSAQLRGFACAIANDLKEPLGTISMFTELLIQEAGLDPCAVQQAQSMASGVARMSALFDGLEAFVARGIEEPAVRLDLGRIVAKVVEDLGHVIKTGNATVEVGPLPFVRGNGENLARVFQNLIINAIKCRSDASVRIHVSAVRLANDWMIRIKDNGIGPETRGAGFGLAICRNIIESAGGAIWVESAPGSGSIFCFTIAFAMNENADSPATPILRDRIVRDKTLLKGVKAASARKQVPPVEITRFANGR